MAFGDFARQDDYGVDPLTGAPFAPSGEAQGKFGRIADAIVGGLRNWVETPGRAYKEGLSREEAADWGAGTAFGMLGVGTPAAMLGAKGTVGAAGGKLGGALPMDEASRMARAREQGYTVDTYHGTGKPGFDVIEARQPALGARGVYSATDPDHANTFARNYVDQTGGVYPLKARGPIASRTQYLELSGKGLKPNEIAEKLKKDGYTGFYEDARIRAW